jgi:hypothetical protein
MLARGRDFVVRFMGNSSVEKVRVRLALHRRSPDARALIREWLGRPGIETARQSLNRAPALSGDRGKGLFFDNVKQHLEDDLRTQGVILNREVVIRRNRGATQGERTDIHIDAVVPGTSGEKLDVVSSIVEVKGCWHDKLWTAMKSQLVDRYLHENRT